MRKDNPLITCFFIVLAIVAFITWMGDWHNIGYRISSWSNDHKTQRDADAYKRFRDDWLRRDAWERRAVEAMEADIRDIEQQERNNRK